MSPLAGITRQGVRVGLVAVSLWHLQHRTTRVAGVQGAVSCPGSRGICWVGMAGREFVRQVQQTWHAGLGRLTRARVNRSTYGNNQAVERAAAVLTPAVAVDRGRRDRPTHHDTSEVCNPPRGVVGYSVLCAGWRFFIISNHSGKRSFCRAELRSLEDPGARTRAVVHRNRKFADSPQERRVKSEPV